MATRGSEPVPTFGLRFDPEAEDPVIDVQSMIEKFRLGFANLQELWALITSACDASRTEENEPATGRGVSFSG